VTTTKTALAFTLPFQKFWSWLQNHPNCILRAGTSEVELFDDDDFHWHFAAEPDGFLVCQVIRGKKLVGELAVSPADITYVQAEPGTEDEYRFELVAEGDGGDRKSIAYHFVLSHGYDESEELGDGPKRFTH
jgi:hypothetical protein